MENRQGSFVLACLVGWWAGAVLCAAQEQRLALPAAVARLDIGPAPRVRALESIPVLPYPRALRAARGVGRRKSVDLARFLWEEGLEAPIDTLPGFGPKTTAAARSVVEALSGSPWGT